MSSLAVIPSSNNQAHSPQEAIASPSEGRSKPVGLVQNFHVWIVFNKTLQIRFSGLQTDFTLQQTINIILSTIHMT